MNTVSADDFADAVSDDNPALEDESFSWDWRQTTWILLAVKNTFNMLFRASSRIYKRDKTNVTLFAWQGTLQTRFVMEESVENNNSYSVLHKECETQSIETCLSKLAMTLI
jgi:hypothetical protein